MSYTIELPNGEKTSRFSQYLEWSNKDLLDPVHAEVCCACAFDADEADRSNWWYAASAYLTIPDPETGRLAEVRCLEGTPLCKSSPDALKRAMHEALDLFIAAKEQYNALPAETRAKHDEWLHESDKLTDRHEKVRWELWCKWNRGETIEPSAMVFGPAGLLPPEQIPDEAVMVPADFTLFLQDHPDFNTASRADKRLAWEAWLSGKASD
jgi:hypothetical protein